MKLRTFEEPKEIEDQKINGFFKWVLHDKTIVVPLLMTISKWSIVILTLIGFIIGILIGSTMLATICGIILFVSTYSLIKFYRGGGAEVLKGMSTNEIVWGGKLKR